MKNIPKKLLQWGAFAAIASTVFGASWFGYAVDVEAYCPFGGLQALGTYLSRGSLACSMSMLQIVVGLALAVGVVLFGKLFCGYLCPLGAVGEWLGGVGRRMGIQLTVPAGSILDGTLRGVKWWLLFAVFYFTLTSSELFCRRFDPYYAAATGFGGESEAWMALTAIALLIAGGVVVRMFWCRYICPLGALSNLFRFIPLFLAGAAAAWGLEALGIERAWVWVLAAVCMGGNLFEIVRMKGCMGSLLAVQRDAAACTSCGLCSKKCPYAIPVADLAKVEHIDCTLCGACISSCAPRALTFNGRRRMRWVPAVVTVGLFVTALWLGGATELPTIDERWGESSGTIVTYKMEGLQSIKCFGSSKALSAKMQIVPGVYGVKTYVARRAVEVRYDPAQTDTIRIQEAVFTPVRRKFSAPADSAQRVGVVRLGVEGLHDRMDVGNLGLVLGNIKGIYGFTADFACPVAVTLYVDPAAMPSCERLERAVHTRKLIIRSAGAERQVAMRLVLRSCEAVGEVSAAEFEQVVR